MEEITTEHHAGHNSHGITLTDEAQHYLNETAGWGKFLGIMGFILSGLMLFAALFAGSFFGYVQRMAPTPGPNPAAGIGGFIGIIYGLIAVLYFFPSLYVYKFGVKAKNGLLNGDKDEITESLSNLKSLYKFWGIVTIVYLAFIVLAIIGVVAGIGMMAGRH